MKKTKIDYSKTEHGILQLNFAVDIAKVLTNTKDLNNMEKIGILTSIVALLVTK